MGLAHPTHSITGGQEILVGEAQEKSLHYASDVWNILSPGVRGLWGLVNNAGINCLVAPNEWLRKEDFGKVLDINLLGRIDMLQMLPLVRRARGRVVNISSSAGRLAAYGGGYVPSKFAVEELSPFGVRTSIIEPGGFATNMFNNVGNNIKDVFNHMPPHIKECYGQPYLDTYYRFMCTLEKKSQKNLYLITDCIENALMSRYSRTRYSAGWDAKFLFLPASYLPTAITDYVYTFVFPKPAQAVYIPLQQMYR
uniref:Uncharacterized protein n=1 Tax=Laticauda laticaudata TaxID=8630 RepID=A0A8C5SB32_LATLA